jgi:hypothetical protein
LPDETGPGALDRLRSLCALLPEVAEIDSFGRPTFRVAVRAFAAFEEIGDRPCVIVKLALDEQAALVAREGFRPEDETGAHGWTVVDVATVGWDELDRLVVASYRLIAPGHLVAQLDAILR